MKDNKNTMGVGAKQAQPVNTGSKKDSNGRCHGENGKFVPCGK